MAVIKKTSSELTVSPNTVWVSTSVHRWLLCAKFYAEHQGQENGSIAVTALAEHSLGQGANSRNRTEVNAGSGNQRA